MLHHQIVFNLGRISMQSKLIFNDNINKHLCHRIHSSESAYQIHYHIFVSYQNKVLNNCIIDSLSLITYARVSIYNININI